MIKIIRLVHNNLDKCLGNLSHLFMCIAIVVGAIFLSYTNKDTYKVDAWKHQLEMQNESIEELVEKATLMGNRMKVYYDNLITKNNYAIDHDIMPSDAFDNAKNIMSIHIFVDLLFIMTFSTLVVEEYSNRTINNMLCSPNSRNQILLAQFLTGILIMIELLSVLFLSSVLTTGFKYGFSHIMDTVVVVRNNTVVHSTVLVQLVEQLLMFLPSFFFNLCITFTLGHVFKKLVVASAVPIFLCFTGTIITDFLSNYKIGAIWPYVHTNMTQYFDGSQYYDFLSVESSLVVILCYGILLYLISFYFMKKGSKGRC